MDSISIAGETVTAATALAGLILVYLGSLAASYGTYQPTERKTVKSGFLKRAWLAVRLARSICDVLTCTGSGLPSIRVLVAPVQTAGL